MSNSLTTNGLQQDRLPCPSLTPRAYSNLSFELEMPSNDLILCHPFLLPPPIFPSIRVFSNESVLCIRRQQYWSFNFSICPSNENSGLISFRINWIDLLVVQRTLKSLLQHHSSIFHGSDFLKRTLRMTSPLWKHKWAIPGLSSLNTFHLSSQGLISLFPTSGQPLTPVPLSNNWGGFRENKQTSKMVAWP